MRNFSLLLLLSACGPPTSQTDGPIATDLGEDLSVALQDLATADADVIMFSRSGVFNVIDSITRADGGPPESSHATAQFDDGLDAGACTITRVGACEIRLCPAVGVNADSGVITVGGGAQPATLSYAGGNYSFASFAGLNWPVGGAIPVSATGATVPAWSVTLHMPDTATMTAPPASTTTVSRGSDLAFAWTGGTQLVAVVVASFDNTAPAITCRFPAGAGSGTVPASVLAVLPTGSGYMTANVVDHQVVTVGGWNIAAVAAVPALDALGTHYTVNVTIN